MTNAKLKDKAREAVELVKLLGDVIESLNDGGCTVALEVYYNDGDAAMTLPRLSGEFELQVGLYESLTDDLE